MAADPTTPQPDLFRPPQPPPGRIPPALGEQITALLRELMLGIVEDAAAETADE